MNVWRLITHHDTQASKQRMLRLAEQNGRLAIGWSRIGDIQKQGYTSSEDIKIAIKEHYPGLQNAGSGGVCLHDFCYRMQVGDLVILSTGGKRALVMQVTGGYHFEAARNQTSAEDYQHQRQAQVMPLDADALWRRAGSGPIVTHNKRWTLIQCRQPVNEFVIAELTAK